MGKRRIHRHKGPRLTLPTALIEAIESVHGPLDDRRNIDRIVHGVKQLHQGLTRDRESFTQTRYMQDPDVRFAYSTYFLCAQAPKLWPVLDRVISARHAPEKLRVLELGCGPGTGLAALSTWARDRQIDLQYLGTDYATAALNATRKLACALNLEIQTQHVDLEQPIRPQLGQSPRFDLILGMNVFNELSESALNQIPPSLLDVLSPSGHLVFIEPAARAPSRKAIGLRDLLVQNKWHLAFPCTHQKPCPALANHDGWCHETWAFERPAFMARVDQKVGTRRETLKATWFAMNPPSLANQSANQVQGQVRAVSELFSEKGRVRITGCTNGQLINIELQRRDRTAENKALMDAARFSLLSFTGGKPVGDAIRLGSDATCIEHNEWRDNFD